MCMTFVDELILKLKLGITFLQLRVENGHWTVKGDFSVGTEKF